MKFIEKLVLIIYSYIILLLAVVLCLLVFKWLSFDVVTNIINFIVTDVAASKITLAISVIFMLL